MPFCDKPNNAPNYSTGGVVPSDGGGGGGVASGAGAGASAAGGGGVGAVFTSTSPAGAGSSIVVSSAFLAQAAKLTAKMATVKRVANFFIGSSYIW